MRMNTQVVKLRDREAAKQLLQGLGLDIDNLIEEFGEHTLIGRVNNTNRWFVLQPEDTDCKEKFIFDLITELSSLVRLSINRDHIEIKVEAYFLKQDGVFARRVQAIDNGDDFEQNGSDAREILDCILREIGFYQTLEAIHNVKTHP